MANPKLNQHLFLPCNGTTNTVIKAGAGTLHKIFGSINANGDDPGVGARVFLYDNATTAAGTLIAALDFTVGKVFDYGVDFADGLAIKLQGGSVSGVTVIFS